MAVYKLSIEDFEEIDYYLIAIHTALEDFRLAYFINQKLPILLSKSKAEIQINIKEGETQFSRFVFEDLSQESYWNLLQNKNEVVVQKKDNQQNLFANTALEVSTKVYLLPEMKKVDYFLKIENSEIEIDDIISKLQSIKSISTLYSVENQNIKSKNNLIF